jgi:hypothetical protein
MNPYASLWLKPFSELPSNSPPKRVFCHLRPIAAEQPRGRRISTLAYSESSGLSTRDAEIAFTEVHALHVIFDERPRLLLRGTCAFEKHLHKQFVVLLLKDRSLVRRPIYWGLSAFDTVQVGHFPHQPPISEVHPKCPTKKPSRPLSPRVPPCPKAAPPKPLPLRPNNRTI